MHGEALIITVFMMAITVHYYDGCYSISQFLWCHAQE
uniref:Uncharacterized protein n=1 Tax=Anguilla anguilla TaxID=7936 RepID=A0A0E9Q0R0_ANGAN